MTDGNGLYFVSFSVVGWIDISTRREYQEVLRYRIKVLSLLCLLWPTLTFSQDEIRLDIKPSKISTRVNMIVPEEQYILFERYYFFKYNYWIARIDTLKKLENGMLQGDSILINPKVFTEKSNKCDTIVNKIRNASLNHKLISELRVIARKEIGYDNKEFIDNLYNRRPTEKDENKICHEEFKIIDYKWYEEQRTRIKKIKDKKLERLEWIKGNGDKIDKEFIKTFLRDFGSCETDQVAIIELMTLKTDDFLNVCKDLDDLDFHSVKVKLTLLPAYINTDEAIEKMKQSKIKSNRKRKLIKRLSS